MLDRLLSTLEEGGIHTPTQLAGQLGVSERLVEHMLTNLSHMGYLRPISNLTCQCANCSLAGTCVRDGSGSQVWALTDRAFR